MSMRKFMKKLEDPTYVEAMRNKRKEHIKSLSVEFQLGCYVGDYIVDKYLPSLNVDALQGRNVINVTPEEKLHYDKLDSEWYARYNETKENDIPEWTAFMSYRKYLKNKHLPPLLECYISPLNIKNVNDFKRGVMRSLWDCDRCSYKASTVDDIVIEMDDNYFSSIIKLTLDYE